MTYIKQDTILILTSELSWHKIREDDNIRILSPQGYDITFDGHTCHYQEIDGVDRGQFEVDGILWREGHIIPDTGLEELLGEIKEAGIPCLNAPEVTLKCMDTVQIVRECLSNAILAKYCKFELQPYHDLDIQAPVVIKLPNFHGGIGKWFVRTAEELEEVLDTKQKISWGEHHYNGYLSKEPAISEYLLVEPFVSGNDTRIYVYRDRKADQYRFKYLYRTVKEGHWLANRHTDTFELYDEENEEIEELCMEAVKLLHYPDLVGIDLIRNDDEITILEINNDVPGLAALELNDDYTIHQTMLANIKSLLN